VSLEAKKGLLKPHVNFTAYVWFSLCQHYKDRPDVSSCLSAFLGC